MAEMLRYVVFAALTAAVSGCTVYGGAATARVSGTSVETASRSASVGTQGVETRSSRTRTELILPE
ncbi:hypothetical protein [Neoaquamicrobium sediminum]|uniref:hypothetical protein n=1 Tax=Neoaquamicrobium sediminum TaxID=1849104 RepID=UPI003BA8BB63